MPLKVYTINDSSEVAPLLLALIEQHYQQVLCDVITTKTSQIYGLKGLLLQSGKESIVTSTEEASFIYKHLSRKDDITYIMK